MEKLAQLLDVPLRVTVELGTARVQVADLLQLRSGSVLELEQLEGEPLMIRAGGKLIARGVAVVTNGRLGIRITEIASDVALPRAG